MRTTRRAFLTGTAAAIVARPAQAANTLKLWISGCSHVTGDLRHGYNTMRDAIIDAEAIGFDIAINLGDVTGLGLPTPSEGVTWRSQLAAGLQTHRPEDIYSVCGNHDRTDAPGSACGAWFRRYVDPIGEYPTTSGINNARRPYPVQGTWERYRVDIGGLVLLFISDTARPLTPGRDRHDGDPGGVVSPETYAWWQAQLAAARAQRKIALTFGHYMPKDSTTATGDYEGGTLIDGVYTPVYHGPGSTNGRCSSYLAFVGETPGRPFIEHIEKHPGACAAWIAPHNHVDPRKQIGGKGHIERLHGCTFVQAGVLTRTHHSKAKERYPRSRFLTFTAGSDRAILQTYMHEDTDYAPRGMLAQTRAIPLPRPVQL